MNENNNNNDFTNVQNNPEIETLDVPVQQTFNQSANQPIDNGMNNLNNLSSGPSTSVSSQLKKNAKKTPFLIIAAVLIFFLLAGGTGVVVKTQIFDKAPNDILKPGENADTENNDKNDKNDKEEIEEGTVEIGDLEDGMVYIQIGDSEFPIDADEAANAGKTPSSYETIEDAITNEEGYVEATQKELHEFDTYAGPAVFRFSNSGPVYLLESDGPNVTISQLYDENNYANKTELLRRTYDPIVYTLPGGGTEIVHVTPIAFHSQNYLMLKIVRDMDRGFYIILDNTMKVLFEGPYYEQSTPKATDDAFYIGSMNCNGKLSNNKFGPAFEIFRFDTKAGTLQYQYNIDYVGEEDLCMQ